MVTPEDGHALEMALRAAKIVGVEEYTITHTDEQVADVISRECCLPALLMVVADSRKIADFHAELGNNILDSPALGGA